MWMCIENSLRLCPFNNVVDVFWKMLSDKIVSLLKVRAFFFFFAIWIYWYFWWPKHFKKQAFFNWTLFHYPYVTWGGGWATNAECLDWNNLQQRRNSDNTLFISSSALGIFKIHFPALNSAESQLILHELSSKANWILQGRLKVLVSFLYQRPKTNYFFTILYKGLELLCRFNLL